MTDHGSRIAPSTADGQPLRLGYLLYTKTTRTGDEIYIHVHEGPMPEKGSGFFQPLPFYIGVIDPGDEDNIIVRAKNDWYIMRRPGNNWSSNFLTGSIALKNCYASPSALVEAQKAEVRADQAKRNQDYEQTIEALDLFKEAVANASYQRAEDSESDETLQPEAETEEVPEAERPTEQS